MNSYWRVISTLQFIFGMNVKNAVPAPGRVRKMYCVTICCVISVTYIAFFVYHVNLYHVCEFVEYVLTVLVYLLHNEEHVKVLCGILESTDVNLPHKKFTYICHVRKTIILFMSLVVLKLCYVAVLFGRYADEVQRYPLGFTIFMFLVLAKDVNNLARFMYFDILKFKMKSLRLFLGIKFSRKAFLGSERDLETVKNIPVLRFLNMYRDLLDEANKIQDIFNVLIFVSLAIAFPNAVICMYNFLLEKNALYFTENILILLCNIFFVLLMPCIHGVAAEQTAGEVDKIKLILLEHSVKDIDDREKNEARLFLRYSDLRAFRVRVWRTFAVDANLPIALISLYTTYFIILVQLTHLYD